MNGIHDMGGMGNFGPVIREENEPVFHAEWERRMFAVAHAVTFTVPFGDDQLRREIERIKPADYLNSSYYELWFRAVTTILKQREVITDDDLEHRNRGPQQDLHPEALVVDDVESVIMGGVETRRPKAEIPQQLSVGDRIRVHNNHPYHHTRVPLYCRGKVGTIVRDHGVFVNPDSNSEDLGEVPQHCYAVEFDSQVLWGDDAEAGTFITIDLQETYMEKATD